MTTVTGYFANTYPALDPTSVAALVGQEPALTCGGARTSTRTLITRASAAAGVVRVVVDVPDDVQHPAAGGQSARQETAMGIRALERDGATIESVDVWRSGAGVDQPGADEQSAVDGEAGGDPRPWAERVLRGRHRGSYATASIDELALADPTHRRIVVDRTKAEAGRRWAASFGSEPHDRYRLRIERVPGCPGTFEINVVLVPVGTRL